MKDISVFAKKCYKLFLISIYFLMFYKSQGIPAILAQENQKFEVIFFYPGSSRPSWEISDSIRNKQMVKKKPVRT